jgi:hypothetical protein
MPHHGAVLSNVLHSIIAPQQPAQAARSKGNNGFSGPCFLAAVSISKLQPRSKGKLQTKHIVALDTLAYCCKKC